MEGLRLSLQEEHPPPVLVSHPRPPRSERPKLWGCPDPTSWSHCHQQRVQQEDQTGRHCHDASAATNQLHPSVAVCVCLCIWVCMRVCYLFTVIKYWNAHCHILNILVSLKTFNQYRSCVLICVCFRVGSASVFTSWKSEFPSGKEMFYRRLGTRGWRGWDATILHEHTNTQPHQHLTSISSSLCLLEIPKWNEIPPKCVNKSNIPLSASHYCVKQPNYWAVSLQAPHPHTKDILQASNSDVPFCKNHWP